jgi:serine/threonine protein kinase
LEDITGQQATIYCLKIVSKSVVSRQHSEQKFFTEAELLSTLSSPFIVRLYGRFQTVDDLVFVMENISEGGDLWGLMYENLTGV